MSLCLSTTMQTETQLSNWHWLVALHEQTQIKTVSVKNTQLSLPKEIWHVCVGTVNSTKPRQQSHESDTDNTNTTDKLLNGQDT